MPRYSLFTLFILTLVTSAVVSSFVQAFQFSYWHTRTHDDMEHYGVNSLSMMSPAGMRKMMETMMGSKDADQIPLKTVMNRDYLLNYELKDGVKEFQLTAEPIRWEYEEGKTIFAWAYNGGVPGPEIRVTEGDTVRVIVTNKLPKATTIHWHGMEVPYEQDGVPGVSQIAIQPGEIYTYEFIAKPSGTHFYHSHGSSHNDEAQQMDMGLSGAFIVEPSSYSKPSFEYTLLLDDWAMQPMESDNRSHSLLWNPVSAHGDGKHEGMINMSMMSGLSEMNSEDHQVMQYNLFTINGETGAEIEPMKVKQGDRIRLRLINASTSTFHPMHLHGHQFKVVAIDGNELPSTQQFLGNTITLHPGEIRDIEFLANNPGVWLFHCHELHHSAAGMLLTIVYEGYDINTYKNGGSILKNMHPNISDSMPKK